MAGTLAEKLWESHVVRRADGEPDLLYIDLHLVHEVTSPQAFDGLRAAGRTVRRPDLTMATEDHNVPTLDILQPIADPVSRAQVEALRKNAAEFGIRLAIGSEPRHLLTGVLREGAVIAAAGIVTGVAGGFVLARLVGGYIQDVRLPGILPILGAAMLLVAAAILASLIPAARASRVDVTQALRSD